MPATRHPANLYPRTFASCCGKHLLSGGLSSVAPARARRRTACHAPRQGAPALFLREVRPRSAR